MSDPAFGALFAQHWAGALPDARSLDLERALQDLWQRARVAWPLIPLDTSAFLRHLAERVASNADVPAALGKIFAEDLFLACGCARGDAAALAAFESHHLGRLEEAVGHLRLSSDQIEELRQALRERLLVASAGGNARIAEYNGRGPLAGWVRISAVRSALDLLERCKAIERRARAFAREAVPVNDPELDYIKSRYREVFATAFDEALRELTPRERNLLRFHFSEGVTTDELGALHGVHRTTVARWLVAAQEKVFRLVRLRLTELLKTTAQEAESLVRLLRSRLDVTLREVFRDGKPNP